MSNDNEEFYQNCYNSLSQLYSVTQSDLSCDEQKNAFPIFSEFEGQGLERYIRPQLIGEGGMKYIYRVHDYCSDREVAKAVLKQPGKGIARERFLREARISASLQHPNILPIYDIGVDEKDEPFFIMELLNGETLGSILSKLSRGDNHYKLKYPRAILLEIFSKVCDAVSYAHSCGILHLDLKPDNIYINDYGQVHVCDWGLSHAVDEDYSYYVARRAADCMGTLSGKERGTPGFMAPEQCLPKGSLRYQTDVYAMGAILYSILTYSLPINGKDVETLLGNTLAGAVIPFSNQNLDVEISSGLEAVVMKSLELDSAERYESVDQLQSDLVNYLRGYATEAEEASFITLLKLLVHRNKTVVSIISVTLIVISVVVIIAFSNISRERALAESLRIVAEKRLDLFKHEQAVTDSQRINIDRLLLNTEIASNANDLKHTLTLIEEGLKRSLPIEKQQALYGKKGQLHFVKQEYHAAVDAFEKTELNFWTEAYNRAALKNLDRKSDDEILTDKQLAAVIRQLSSKGLPIVKALYEFQMKHGERPATPIESASLAKAMIDSLNYTWDNRWEELKLTKREKGYHLDLSHVPYDLFRSQHESLLNVLRPLDLYSIDLSYSSFFDFFQLVGSGVKEVTIVGCKFPDIGNKRLRQIQAAGIERLILSRDDFSSEELERFETGVEVIDVGELQK